ncbi:MAG: ImmA/IrrE family metallo-endopeptidase, partial [Candidatus Woesearchaeota archaeon]
FDYDKPKNLGLGSKVLGAIYPDGKIFLNSKMNKPNFSEGRHRFTIAHEIGHWVLHKNILNGNKEYTSSLFRKDSILNQEGKKIILCREDDNSAAEWQANKFAALLLMPPHLFVPKYKKIVNKLISNNKNNLASLNSKISFELSNIFNTSMEATKIHIKELNLNPKQMSLF